MAAIYNTDSMLLFNIMHQSCHCIVTSCDFSLYNTRLIDEPSRRRFQSKGKVVYFHCIIHQAHHVFPISAVNFVHKLEVPMSGRASFKLAVDYYNRSLSGWEPFLEQWGSTVLWNRDQHGKLAAEIKGNHNTVHPVSRGHPLGGEAAQLYVAS